MVSIGNVEKNEIDSISLNLNEIHTKQNIKKQYVVENVGHFKFYRNNSILINFIDKVKLYVSEYSTKMFCTNQLKKCTINFYLPDASQHEIIYTEMPNSGHFSRYLDFLNQWLNWLSENNALPINDSQAASKSDDVNLAKTYSETLSTNTLQSHLNELKLFNFTLKHDSEHLTSNNSIKSTELTKKNDPNLSLSVSNLLRQNSKFLENISK